VDVGKSQPEIPYIVFLLALLTGLLILSIFSIVAELWKFSILSAFSILQIVPIFYISFLFGVSPLFLWLSICDILSPFSFFTTF
jgi:hypothetical protein